MSVVGTWVNQLGSTLDIGAVDNVTGALSGSYMTAVGKPSPVKQHAIAGYSQGTLIGFTVSYDDIDCICCWVGRLQEDGNLHTMWQFVTESKIEAHPDTGMGVESPADLWEAFHFQSDIFSRSP